ncbi:MAG: ABC transporter permease [Acidobacteria bacterium]|nr:ABC transporter permease [Acidobacteriota bacterium]
MARHNLGTVIRFEVGRTLSKPRFWVAILAVPALLVVIGLLVSLSGSGTDASTAAIAKSRFSFGYSDASGIIDPGLAAKAGGHRVSPGSGPAEVRAGTLTAFFEYPATPAAHAVRVWGADTGFVENGRYSAAAQNLLVASAQARIGSPALAALAAGSVQTDVTTYDARGAVTPGLAGVIPPLLYLLLFYLLILLLGNQMLSALLDEKENRVTEMVLTTIDPTDLILGKVVSLFVVAVVQILVFAVPLAVGYAFFRTSLNIPDLGLSGLSLDPQRMVVGALLLISGFALFTGTLVALGAAMPTAKDAGPIFGGMMILLFVPFYAVSLIVTDPSASIVQIFTFFPYTAPITALVRNAFDNLPLWQGIVVVAELTALSAIVLRVAVRIFRFGSISYTSRVDLRTVLRRPSAARADGAARRAS